MDNRPVPASAPGPAQARTQAPAQTQGPPKAKVLSIGAEAPSAPKSGGTKILSIGTPAAAPKPTKPKEEQKKPAAAAGETAATKPAQPLKPQEKTASAPSSKADSRPAAVDIDAVTKEQQADIDQELLADVYGKEACSVVFLGHVDSGKSTLGGMILVATDMVDQRTLEKYKREAKEMGRETWYLSWALDLTTEERSKGKTVEVGRAWFETEKRKYSILDAPGHRTFTPQAITGAAQADIGVLVISSRRGEYETGFEKGGQTREHAVLAKTQGVNKLVVVINKMDDPTVEWSQERFTECTTKLTAFLKGLGFNPKNDLMFMPISAQTGMGVKDRIPDGVCPWYKGPSLLEYLDGMNTMERQVKAPFMMPVTAKYRELGTMVEGKIEAGVIKKDGSFLLMPNRQKVTVAALYGETEDEIEAARAGDQVRIRLRNVEEEDIMPGFVLCAPNRPVHCVRAFEAQVVFLDLRSIISAGYNCVMHVHSATAEVTFGALLHTLQKGTNKRSKKPPAFAKKGMSVIARLEVIGGTNSLCIER